MDCREDCFNQDIVRNQEKNLIFSYANTAFLSIALWDPICTFPQEVTLIWRRTWTPVKILYLLSRYTPIILFSLYNFLFQIPIQWVDDQGRQTPVSTALSGKANNNPMVILYNELLFFNLTIVEALLICRMWAIWNATRRVGIVLAIGFGIFASGIFITNLVRDAPVLTFSFFSLFYLVMLVLTCLRGRRISALHSSSRFIIVVFRDGILYYASILLLSVAGVLIAYVTDPLNKGSLEVSLLQRFTQLASSVFAARMTLSLKEAGSRSLIIDGEAISPSGTRSVVMSGLIFASNLDDHESEPEASVDPGKAVPVGDP